MKPLFLPPMSEVKGIIAAAVQLGEERIAARGDTEETKAMALILEERIRRAEAVMFGLLPESVLKGAQS